MKDLRTLTVASTFAALFAAAPLHAAETSQGRVQDSPQQLGGPGAEGRSNPGDTGRAATTEEAERYGGQSDSVSGSTGGRGQPGSQDIDQLGSTARERGQQGSTEPGSPESGSSNRSGSPSSSPR